MSLQDEVKLLKQINEMQASRIEEQEKTIEDLRMVIDELRSIKANLEETLEEFKRQIFGVRSEKTSASKATEEPKKEETKKIHVKAFSQRRPEPGLWQEQV